MGVFANYNGEIIIPDEKKNEFKDGMLKILQAGGMMQFDKISMYNKEITLIRPVEYNDEGECNFHYNYFEDDAWESAGFVIDSNRLWSGKIGSYEFSFVMCAGYMLTELYSDDYGVATIDGDIIDDIDCIRWINHVLDKDFSLSKRFELWKKYEAYNIRELKEGYELDRSIVFNFIPEGYRKFMGGIELADIMYIENGTNDGMEDAQEGTYAWEIKNLKKKIKAYFEENPEKGRDDIWKLICLEKNARKEISVGVYGELAQISLRIAARVFVYLSAEILGFSFWSEWINLYEKVYSDEVALQYESDKVLQIRNEGKNIPLDKMKTSEFLRNDSYFAFWRTPEEIRSKGNYYISDDDLIYWREEEGNLKLSNKFLSMVVDWKEYYKKILANITSEEVRDYDMLKSLISILHEADSYYKRIFAFNSMFYEFLENSKDVKYIAGVKLLEHVIESNKESGAIIEKASSRWEFTSKNVTFNEGRVNVKRCLSLLANKKMRGVVFDF